MSNVIDERIVQMKFDNSNFEQNVSTSMSTLDKLKEKLNFKNTSIEGLDKAVSNVNFSPMTNGIETVSKKFSMLEEIGIGALRRIGEQAVNAGEKLVKSLSVDQINAGWQKYADFTTSTQTIMSATASQFEDEGEQMEYVEEQLRKLNWFSDETSYSLTDMTDNIGKFTSAGVDLEASTKAMQGVATAAALAGQNSQTAARAMYNFSQALGAGAVKLVDWKSIENANMATKEFKETIIDTAKELGYIDKKTNMLTEKGKNGTTKDWEEEVNYKNFSQTLVSGWFTSEVLTKALDVYGGFATELSDFYDQVQETTGLTTIEILKMIDEYMEGSIDLNEVSKRTGLTIDNLNESFVKLTSAEYETGRKAFKAAQQTKTFKESIEATMDAVSTKWMQIFQTIFGNYLEAKELWSSFTEYLWDVFAGPLDNLYSALLKWRDLGGRDLLIGTEDTPGIFQNMAAAVSSFTSALKEAFVAIFPVFEDTDSLGEAIYNLTERFKNFTESLILSESHSSQLKEFFKGIFSIAKSLGSVFGKIVSSLVPAGKSITDVIFDIVESIGYFLQNVSYFIDNCSLLESAVDAISRAFKAFNRYVNFDSLKHLFSIFTDKTFFNDTQNIDGFLSPISESLMSIKIIIDQLRKGIISAIGELTGFDFTWLIDLIDNSEDTLRNILKYIEQLGPKLINLFNSLKKNLSEIKIGDNLSKFTNSVKTLFSKVGDFSVQGFVNGILDGIKYVWEAAKKMAKTAILAVEEVLDINSPSKEMYKEGEWTVKGFVNGIWESVKLFADNIANSFKTIFDKIKNVIKKYAPGLLEVINFDNMGKLLGIGILAAFLRMITKVTKSSDSLSKSLINLINSFATIPEKLASTISEFSSAILQFGKAAKWKALGKAMLEFAGSLAIVAGIIVAFSFLPFDKLQNGTNIFVGFAAAMTGFVFALSKIKALDAGKIVILMTGLTLSVMLLISGFSKALKIVNELNTDDAFKKILEAGGILTALIAIISAAVVGINLILKSKGIDVGVTKTLGMFIGISYAISNLVKAFNRIDTDTLASKIAGFMTIVGTLVVMTAAMQDVSFGSAAGIIALAIGIKLVLGVINSIASMDTNQMIAFLKGCVIIIALIGVLFLMIEKFGANSKSVGSAFGGIASAILSIALSVAILGKLDPAEVGWGIGYVTAIMGLLVLFDYFISFINTKFKVEKIKESVKLLTAMSAFVLVLSIFAAGFALLSFISPQALWSGIGAVAAIGAVLAGLYAVMSYCTSKLPESKLQVVASILKSLSTLIISLALSLAVLSIFDTDRMGAGALSMAMVLAVLIPVVNYASKLKDTSWKSLLSFTGIIVAVGASLALIATNPWQQILTAGIAMAGCLAVLIPLTSAVNKIKTNKWKDLLAFAGVVVALGAALAVLASFKLDLSQYLAIGGGLAIALIGLAGAMFIVSKAAEGLIAAIPGMLSFGATVLLIGIGVGAIIASAALLVYTFSLLTNSISKLVEIITSLFDLLANNGVAVANGIVIVTAAIINSINQISISIATALINISMGITAALNNISTYLQEHCATDSLVIFTFIATIASAIAMGIGTISDSVGQGILTIAEKLGEGIILFAVTIIEGIPTVVSAVMDLKDSILEVFIGKNNLEKDMTDAGENITKGLENGIEKGQKDVKKQIKKLALFGVVGTFCGLLDIHSPSRLFELLGFNIDQGLVKGLTNGTTSVEEAAKELGYKSIDGLVSGLKRRTGNKGLGSLITDEISKAIKGGDSSVLGNLLDIDISGIADFDLTSMLGEGFDPNSILNGLGDITSATQKLTDATNNQTKAIDKQTDSVKKNAKISKDELDKLAKETIQGKYGNGQERIEKLGEKWAVVQNRVNEILGSSVRHATNYEIVAEKILDKTKETAKETKKWDTSKNLRDRGFPDSRDRNRVPKNATEKGAPSSISYKAPIKNATDKGLPSSMSDFIPSQSETDRMLKAARERTAETQKTVEATKEIAKTEEKISNTPLGVNKEIIKENVSKAVEDAVTQVKDNTNIPLDVSVNTKDVEALDDKVSQISDKKEVKVTADTVSAEKAIDSFSTGITQMSKSIDIETSKSKQSFVNFFTIIQQTINDYTPMIVSSFKNSFGMAVHSTTTYLESNEIMSDFRNIGNHMAAGIIAGFKAKEKDIKATASQIAKSAANSARKELDINSPSKVFEQIGIYSDEGLINGLLSYLNKVKEAGEEVGTTAFTSVAEQIQQIDFDNMDTTPQIRPVLDLSDIQSKWGTLDTMFSQNLAANVSADRTNNMKQETRDTLLEKQMIAMNHQLTSLTNIMSKQNPTPVNVDVQLEGDAKKLFNIMRDQSKQYTRTTGKYAF